MTGMAYNLLKSPKDLKPHPLNQEIYGKEEPDKDLIESIERNGILETLVIRDDNIILSGHRRWIAAKAMGLEKIPCRVLTFTDDLDEGEALIEFNRQREKTLSQKMKEAEILERIESDRAKQRLITSTGGNNPRPVEILPQAEGKTRDIVAEKIGMSGRTYEKAKTVYQAAQDGDEVAKDLMDRLDKGDKKTSIDKAFTVVKEVQSIRERNGGALLSSESNEWYTPPEIITAVLEVLGEINLDPCSNSKENPNVPASNHYTIEDNGLDKIWPGKVYMNPPYGREVKEWVGKILEEYRAQRTTEAIVLIAGRIDTEWFGLLSDFRWCAIKGRLKFSDHKDSAPFPSAVFYLGHRPEKFASVFKNFGNIYKKTDSYMGGSNGSE